ncbi:hypothetical protein PspLS_03313 [Pyricularia sp. CBS 133598]|nr:hypothetical protein PspLS_03313 [Pyricularia sp. CBS 133598]
MAWRLQGLSINPTLRELTLSSWALPLLVGSA